MNMLVRLLIVVCVAALLYWAVTMLLPLLTLPASIKTVIWVLFVVIGCITALFYLFGTPSWWKWGGPPAP